MLKLNCSSVYNMSKLRNGNQSQKKKKRESETERKKKKQRKRIGFGSWQFSRGELGCPVGFGVPIGPSAACCPGLEEAGSFRPLLRITLWAINLASCFSFYWENSNSRKRTLSSPTICLCPQRPMSVTVTKFVLLFKAILSTCTQFPLLSPGHGHHTSNYLLSPALLIFPSWLGHSFQHKTSHLEKKKSSLHPVLLFGYCPISLFLFIAKGCERGV